MKEPELREVDQDPTQSEADCHDELRPHKKEFLVPEISVPIDVLKATTFFQVTDSGATN